MANEMSLGKAIEIFVNVDSEEFTDIEKAVAIRKIASKETRLDTVKKTEMAAVIRWLWKRSFRVKKKE